MVKIRPFAALRPPRELVREVSACPYDVVSSAEARELAAEKSLLHITRPEIDFTPMAAENEDRCFEHAADNFCSWQERGWLIRDAKPCYYIYGQRMGEHTQYGVVLCSHKDDYFNGAIKRHELTRPDKEEERMKHVLIQSANIEPVFFCYRQNDAMEAIVSRIIASEPEYDFVSDQDGFGHKLWVVSDDADISKITEIFAGIPAMYIADGHHRSAAAARVGQHKQQHNPAHTGEEEYNYFMAVCFPSNQLEVMDYNRLVRDLGGLSEGDLLSRLEADFELSRFDGDALDAAARGDYSGVKPARRHDFSMYMGGIWYKLRLKEGRCDENDPIASLDSQILSDRVLGPVLGITDIRKDSRIDFVGGIRGLGELRARVDSGEMAVAFALHPVSVDEIISVADAGEIMPPKTTWFEPKLRSGLFIHTFFEE